MIYVIIVVVPLFICLIVWGIYRIGYIDGNTDGYEEGRKDELIFQFEEECKKLDKEMEKLLEIEKGKEVKSDDL